MHLCFGWMGEVIILKCLTKKKANNRSVGALFHFALEPSQKPKGWVRRLCHSPLADLWQNKRRDSVHLRKCYLIKYERLLSLQMNAFHLQMNHHTYVLTCDKKIIKLSLKRTLSPDERVLPGLRWGRRETSTGQVSVKVAQDWLVLFSVLPAF